MRIFHWTFFLFIFTWGCTITATADRERIYPIYRDKIKEWQMRIQREGWTEAHLDSILFQFRRLATYQMEIQDHWDTPREFIQKGFSGDCEDIAVFMMGTLKRIGYPYRMRILIVQEIFEDHALLKVERPEGEWKVYDVVPQRVLSLEMTQLKPLVEFDERTMFWYPSQAETSYHPIKGNSFITGRRERPPIEPASPASKSASPNKETIR